MKYDFTEKLKYMHILYISPILSLDLCVILLTLAYLTCNAPNTTIAEFANTVDPDEMAHNEPSHLDLQCLPSIFDFST